MAKFAEILLSYEFCQVEVESKIKNRQVILLSSANFHKTWSLNLACFTAKNISAMSFEHAMIITHVLVS